MRNLKGHVDLLGLGNILQLLSLNKCEGLLCVIKGKDRQAIHFGPGGIRLISSSVARVKRLARLTRTLLGGKPVTAQRLRNLLRKEKLMGWSLGQIALSDAPIREEDLREALRQQVEEEILDMFVWIDASFTFTEGRLAREKAKDPVAALVIKGNMTSILLEAARRADEVRKIRETLTDDSMRLVRLPRDIHADELGEDLVRVDAILPLITGRTLRGVLQASIYPAFATMRAILKLLTLGYVKARAPEGETMRIQAPALQS